MFQKNPGAFANPPANPFPRSSTKKNKPGLQLELAAFFTQGEPRHIRRILAIIETLKLGKPRPNMYVNGRIGYALEGASTASDPRKF